MRWTSRCALLGVSALMVASAAIAQDRPNGNGRNGNGSGIKVSKDRIEMPAENGGLVTTVYVPGTTTYVDEVWNIKFTPFDINAYSSMSEPNIAWHIANVDSGQAQLALLGQSKLTDPRAREFVELAINEGASGAWSTYGGDRSKSLPRGHLAKINEIVVDEHVGSAELSPDPEIERLRQAIQKFTLMPAAAIFDAAYFRFLVAHYQNEYDVLARSRPNAHDDDFETYIDQTLPLLAARRNQALAILVSLPAK
jgi:hypothetical protein